MFPSDIWYLIYHLLKVDTLKNIRLVNKQRYNELNCNFWKLYVKGNLIIDVNYNTAQDYIKEIKYNNYIYTIINKLKISDDKFVIVL